MDVLIFLLLFFTITLFLSARVFIHRRSKTQAGEEETSSLEQKTPHVAPPLDSIEGEPGVGSTSHAEAVEIAPSAERVGGEERASVTHTDKSFGGRKVVQDVSFNLLSGEVFGLVGPNGAGKTTTIRMLMDIIKPDSGRIAVFGQPLGEDTKNRIGYLPEERGLYSKMRVSDSLVYLAKLKEVDSRVARARTEELLKQVDMLPHKDKKISELSRGMGQIIQFLVTIAHNPDLIVLDEPFAGLDPVNRMLVKSIIKELKGQGKTIILSTHMMNEVEEMCDRILMINQGRVVLYGNLAEIKWRYRNNSVFVAADGDIGELEGVSGRKGHGSYVELFLDGEADPQNVLAQIMEMGVRVDRFEVSTPSLNEIFLQLVKQ